MKISNLLTVSLLVLLLSAASGCASTSKSTSQPINTQASDSAITANVMTATNDDERLNTSDMNVATTKGVVVLSGFVGTHAEMTTAREIARGIAGVTDVKNEMMVKSLR